MAELLIMPLSLRPMACYLKIPVMVYLGLGPVMLCWRLNPKIRPHRIL